MEFLQGSSFGQDFVNNCSTTESWLRSTEAACWNEREKLMTVKAMATANRCSVPLKCHGSLNENSTKNSLARERTHKHTNTDCDVGVVCCNALVAGQQCYFETIIDHIDEMQRTFLKRHPEGTCDRIQRLLFLGEFQSICIININRSFMNTKHSIFGLKFFSIALQTTKMAHGQLANLSWTGPSAQTMAFSMFLIAIHSKIYLVCICVDDFARGSGTGQRAARWKKTHFNASRWVIHAIGDRMKSVATRTFALNALYRNVDMLMV